MTPHRSDRTRAERWRFARHYLEMVVAMLVGMSVLGPLESALLDPLGWQSVRAVPELDGLVMATNTTAATVAWTGYRGHSRAAPGLMVGSQVPAVRRALRAAVAGAVSPTGMLVGGHVLMLPAMAGAMLLRRDEYTGPHSAARS